MKITEKFTSVGGWVVVGIILAAAAAFMFTASHKESAIMDELAHIPAGYSYVRFLDFRLNPEHPPLLKALAGLPLALLNLKFPTTDPSWATDVNGQWEAGRLLLYRAGNDADQVIQFARIGPILLTLLLALIIFLWASELMGRGWALIPTFLFALSPNVLAHGHYVTTDIAAAFGVTLATWWFLKYLLEPTKGSLLKAGLAFGIAQACKFSAVLLFPYFLFLAFAFWLAYSFRSSREQIPHRLRHLATRLLREVGGTFVVFVIGFLLVIYPLYALFTVNYPIERQSADTNAILESFSGGPTPVGEICNPGRCLAELNMWMAKTPIIRPAGEYFLGVLMVLQRSAGGNTNYFLNEVSAGGWHYYFPVVYALKEPLPVVILVVTALLLSLWGLIKIVFRQRWAARWRFTEYLGTHFNEFAMISFIVLYWTYSIQSPLNIGVRHLFPTLPLIYILATGFWKRWLTDLHLPATNDPWTLIWRGTTAVISGAVKYAALLVLLVWFAFETALSAPYFLSYFNQLGGGTWNGYKMVTDSNYDWGQDMLRLKTFVDAHPEIARIGVDYFGGAEPKYYLGQKEENWWSARGNPTNEGIHWLAVSVNTLQGAIQRPVPGFERKSEDEYSWLSKLRPAKDGFGELPPPDYRIGTSIFVYKL